ncbi:MAG: hypothetical protein EOO45_11640 [Flavobacterium sp.]|nr:MAG: hypothetical protein EOO45_11640 [Flavobacterium sp.]
MKKASVLLLLLLFGSCRYFDSKVPSEEELLQKRLDEINWSEVSTYPSIAECEGVLDKEQKKECFFSSMTRLVQEKLDTDTIAMLYPEIDTIMVKVTVYPDASLKFEPQMTKDSVAYNRVKIDSILKSRLADFPKIEPAQKEGVPVTTQFILPVILNLEQ